MIFFKSFFIWASRFYKQLKCYTLKLHLRESKIIFLSSSGRVQEYLQVRVSDLGVLNYEVCVKKTVATNSKMHKSYQKWSDKEHFKIGKYAKIYGSTAA